MLERLATSLVTPGRPGEALLEGGMLVFPSEWVCDSGVYKEEAQGTPLANRNGRLRHL